MYEIGALGLDGMVRDSGCMVVEREGCGDDILIVLKCRVEFDKTRPNERWMGVCEELGKSDEDNFISEENAVCFIYHEKLLTLSCKHNEWFLYAWTSDHPRSDWTVIYDGLAIASFVHTSQYRCTTHSFPNTLLKLQQWVSLKGLKLR